MENKKDMEGVYHQVPPEYWDKAYKNPFQRFWYILRFRIMKKILKELPSESVILDVGCGSGFSMEKSIPRGKKFEVCGIDVTDNVIEYAKKKRPQFNFIKAYGEEMPFEDKKFDAVLYLDVIEHLIDPIKSLREAYRVLKDDGFVVTLVVKEHHLLFRIIWWLWMKTRGRVWEDAHLHIYDETLLNKHLSAAGFKILKLYKTHFGMNLVAVANKY